MRRAPQVDTAEAVLAKAAVRAGDRLGLSRAALSRVLGVSEATVSRLARGRVLDPESKEGELALLLIRLFRGLDAFLGGEEEATRRWMAAENHALGGAPVDLVQRVEGLVRAVDYVDAFRGLTGRAAPHVASVD